MGQPPCCVGKTNCQEPGVDAELNFEFLEFYHYIFLITNKMGTEALCFRQ